MIMVNSFSLDFYSDVQEKNNMQIVVMIKVEMECICILSMNQFIRKGHCLFSAVIYTIKKRAMRQ